MLLFKGLVDGLVDFLYLLGSDLIILISLLSKLSNEVLADRVEAFDNGLKSSHVLRHHKGILEVQHFALRQSNESCLNVQALFQRYFHKK